MSETGTAPAAGSVIAAQGLGHVYKGGHVALDGVDLALGTGLFGLLGPNGAGKSTLMRIICTLLTPTRGSVTVCGFDSARQRREVRERIGYLPQEFGAWRSHRAEEVLDTLARLSGLSDKRHRRRRIAETLALVGLEGVADRKVKQLSGGMVRRLGVAQALVHEPRVLVVDEPTVGLDPEERMRFRQVMARLGQDRTILLSTHIVADLGAGCAAIALLDGGRIVYQGTPAALLEVAAGRVFELVASAAESDAIEERYEVVSRSIVDGQVAVRGVSAEDLPAGATAVAEPTLEEAYLAFMAKRGRSVAARQDEGRQNEEQRDGGQDETQDKPGGPADG